MKSFLRKIYRGFRHAGLLSMVFGLLVSIRLLLSFWRFDRTQRFLDRTSSYRDLQTDADITIDRRVGTLRWAVRAVARRLFGDKPCLPQALGLQWLLRRRGYDTLLHIGVRKDDKGKLEAHAWLEKDDFVLIGGSSSRYTYAPLDPSVINRIR